MLALPLSAAVPPPVCAEWALVLDAAGIHYEVRAEAGGASLWVTPEDHPRAVRELRQYLRENRPAPAAPRHWPRHRHAAWAVLAFAAVLLAVAMAALFDAGGREWLARGALLPGFLAAGEWWRPVTALTLHSGPLHLASNLLFGAIFLYAAAQLLGIGVALATVLAAATLANAVDAALHPPGHLMIGASTAVFAALGIVAALAWRRRAAPWAGLRWQAAPVAAALALLALTGTGGEDTDILAHLLGLLAGLGGGLVAARLPLPPPGRAAPQWLAMAAAATLLLAAWGAALG